MRDYILERDISQTNYAVPVNGDYTYVSSDYIISNRSSVNKTEAVKFLKFIITELSIGEELYTGSEYIQMIYYLKNVSYETAYMWWRYVSTDITVMLN
jgi:spermidine/putrescine-binding protein